MPTPRTQAFKPRIILSNDDDVLIDFNKRIGEWVYGPLYEGHSRSQNRKVMVKIVDLKKFPLPKSCLDTEVTLLKKLQGNKYVVNFADYRYYQNTLTLTTDIYNKGDLRAYLKKRAPLPEVQALNLLLQILHGLKPLHEMDYCHGAIRPENILLHEDGSGITPKLTNFVFARSYSSEPLKKVQLPYDSLYLSPEALKDLHYSSKSDIWALGVLYYEMLYGRTPWVGKNMKDLEKKIVEDLLEFPTDDSISESSTSFISKCLERDPSKRMSWGDLLLHRLIFRGMFSGGDGTYKTTNNQFQEETPTNSKLVYGLRRKSSNNLSSRVEPRSFAKQQPTNLKIRCETNEIDNAELDTAVLTALDDTRTRTEENLKAYPLAVHLGNTSVQSVASQSERSKNQTMYYTPKPTSKKNHDEKFYSRYVSSVATIDDFFTLSSMKTQKTPGKYASSVHKAYTAPFKQVSLKVEMLGELYELLHKNKDYPLYDKIQKILETEAHKLNNSIGTLTNISQNFGKKLEESVNRSSSITNSHLIARRPKTTLSVPKKKKCSEILELLEEILTTIVEHAGTSLNSSNEDIVMIAANLKMLREFDEIGEDMQKKLATLKDILQMFYRQKHYDHLRYLLLVKNFV